MNVTWRTTDGLGLAHWSEREADSPQPFGTPTRLGLT